MVQIIGLVELTSFLLLNTATVYGFEYQILNMTGDQIKYIGEDAKFYCACTAPKDDDENPAFYFNDEKQETYQYGLSDGQNKYIKPQNPSVKDKKTKVVKMNLVISSVSLKDSGVVTCRCPKNGDRRSSLLAVQSPGVDLHVVIDGYSSLKPQLSRIETNNVGIVWFLDLRRLEYLDHFTGYVDCLQTSPICTNLPVLMDDKSAKFEAMSDRVGNGTRYTLTENTLFKQMGRFRCVCFEESSVTTEDGSTEPRSIKHWSQLVAIGRSPSPHPPSKTEVIAAETRKIVLSIPALYVYQWGFPTASIRWIKRDGTKELQISEEESGRVQFFYNDTSLLIPHAEAGDTGDYLCVVENDFARRVFGFKVKVIDKYSAVWPFFGLVLQVAFFSIAIIIYERHSKRQRSDSSD